MQVRSLTAARIASTLTVYSLSGAITGTPPAIRVAIG